jgi:methyl-accepting chemotaxis protein
MATTPKKKRTRQPAVTITNQSMGRSTKGLFASASIGSRLFLIIAITSLLGLGGLGGFLYSRLGQAAQQAEIEQSLNSDPAAPGASENQLSAIRTQALQATAIATILVLLALLAVVNQFMKNLNRRLQPILEQCDRLAAARGSEVAEQSQGGDTIERLSVSFNNLIEEINTNEQRIRDEVARIVQTQEQVKRSVELEQESELIEIDVGDLLDVVSALEEGDLTVQAEVSDRATGLVADTLNRLIEQLIQIIANVLRSAQQVAGGAKDLEALARTSADNTEEQAKSVAEGLALVEQVAVLAQNAAAQIKNANQSLLNVQATVTTGQAAINDLSQGITVLQDGSGKIVQRMKTLGEFVGLAEQFVQDQGQIASLTQVLAINATLVAARAAEQRDPKQFIGVAREFEAIAGQVNNLATQTNEGLAVLQQRTAQIQSVVSAIDAEVQGLGGLVAGFTAGVEKSQQAFYSVRNVTEEVVQVGQEVTNASFEIASASESTAQYIGDIAQLAERTADLTGKARLQAEQMGDLAQRLLTNIQFFQLPEAALVGDDDRGLELPEAEFAGFAQSGQSGQSPLALDRDVTTVELEDTETNLAAGEAIADFSKASEPDQYDNYADQYSNQSEDDQFAETGDIDSLDAEFTDVDEELEPLPTFEQDIDEQIDAAELDAEALIEQESETVYEQDLNQNRS